jgi:hypothetical protein
MREAELQLQASATRAFILADPEDLILVRRSRQSDGAGGFTYANPVSLAAQTARLIPQSDQTLEVIGSDGRSAHPDWVILMEPGSDLQRYDQFDWRGDLWEVAQIHQKPDYEMKGDVIRV